MSGQPTVLQVVILRDGLLVGTEVFVPGQYTLGSGPDVDLRLDDAAVGSNHALLVFQNGRAAIKDTSGGGTFVNGHTVTACEVRSVDEIVCGPFTLKIRVMGRKAQSNPAPHADVSALLNEPSPNLQPPRRIPPPRTVGVSQGARPPPPPPATVISVRRSNAAHKTEEVSARAPHLRPVPTGEHERIALHSELFGNSIEEVEAEEATTIAPLPDLQNARPMPPRAPLAVTHNVQPQARKIKNFMPTLPSATEGKGKSRLFVELYWGDTRHYAHSYRHIDGQKKLVAREDDLAPLPLYGFPLEGSDFVFAEQSADLDRVYVPPGASVEQRAQDGRFYPVQLETLAQAPDSRRCITLGNGHAVRFSSDKNAVLMAYVQPAIPKPFVNPLKGFPWLAMTVLTLFLSAFGAFIFYAADLPLDADFQSKSINPVAVKLIAPPKPDVQKKMEQKLEKLQKKEKKPEKKPEIAKKPEKTPVQKPVVVPPETTKALKSIEKLAAAGPAMKDLLAAVDKLGSGLGAKNAKNNFKLSGLIGKAPIANAGIGTFGLGGGGANGSGIQGAELLRGKGGGSIGALGAGNIGKSVVAGTVTRAATRSIGARGSIDKEAVAKVINSHLHEVSSCYERALLKTPGLAGKIVLEWQITTSGTVGFAKTKSSTMQSAAVESCILSTLKTWRFPAARGTGVVITYPFMFNSVGY